MDDRRSPIGFPVPQAQKEASLIMDWRHKAACLDTDPELFFPIGTTGPALDQIERAKVICRQCDVTAQCLDWSLETNQDAGVWGGLSEDERRTLRRSRQRRRCSELNRQNIVPRLIAPDAQV